MDNADCTKILALDLLARAMTVKASQGGRSKLKMSMAHGAQAATEEKTKTPAKREADDESSLDEDDDELPEDALEEEASDYDEDQVYEGGKSRKTMSM